MPMAIIVTEVAAVCMAGALPWGLLTDAVERYPVIGLAEPGASHR
jgi:hypothetical protein